MTASISLRSAFLLTMALTSCASSQSGTTLEADDFEERLKDGNIQLIDVRTAAEFASGHLDEARNLDWSSGQLEAELPNLDHSKPTLLYCASGRRSAAASTYMRAQGFSDVDDLHGGILAWRAANKLIAR